MLSDTLNNLQLLEQLAIYCLMVMVILLGVLVVVYSTRADKYYKLFNSTNKEAKLLARTKSTYERELKTFANLMDEITFPIWQRDKDLNIIYCNTKFCEVAGDIRENIIELGDVELFRDSREFANRALKTGQVQVIEQNIVILGNNTLNQVIEIPISDKSSNFGAKNGTIGFAMNLIELQNTRERLKLNLELQKRLLESLNSAVAIYGVNQKLEYYNRAFVDLWKLDEDWLKIYPSYGEILEMLREKNKLPEQADFASFKRDNLNMFTNLISKKEDYYYLSDGRVLKIIIIPYQNRGLLFYYEDMTNQLSLERSYNTLVSVQRYTLDNLNEAVVVFAENGKLGLFNPNFARLWGITESFLKSEPHITRVLDEIASFYKVDNAKLFKEDFIAILGSRNFSERKMTRNDGVVLMERFTPLPDGATLITYFDITDKENVERSLRAEKKAYEEADKIKTNFLGNVSYELRSPLTSIMGFTEMLVMLYGDKLTGKPKEYIGDILASSHKLKELIDDIIDVSSFDAGYSTLSIRKADITGVINPVFEDLKPIIKEKKITLNSNIAGSVDILIVDKIKMQKAIRAILNCSIAMSKMKQNIEFKVSSENGRVKFEISDEGSGITEKDLPQMFDQFHKLQSGDLHNTGVGLYLAKKIIESHQGSIKVISKPDQGTKFIFEIPA